MYACEYFSYIFEPPNAARVDKMRRLFAGIRAGSALDLGCGMSGIYWALAYVESVESIDLWDYYDEVVRGLEEQLRELNPEYLEEKFSSTVEVLKTLGLIAPESSYESLAYQLSEKIRGIRRVDFREEASGNYDLVISNEALECVSAEEELRGAFRTVRSLLTPGGEFRGVVSRYAERNEITDQLIEMRLEGSLNPDAPTLRRAMEHAGLQNISAEPFGGEEGQRSEFISLRAEAPREGAAKGNAL